MPRVILIDPDRTALAALQAALGQAGFRMVPVTRRVRACSSGIGPTSS
jgi:hypothetical protein